MRGRSYAKELKESIINEVKEVGNVSLVSRKHGINYYKEEYSENYIDPLKESIKISLIYFIVGIIWLFLSDIFVRKYNVNNYEKIHIYKDIVYIIITTILFFILNYKKNSENKNAVEKINSNYKELEIMQEDLIFKEKQLKDQIEIFKAMERNIYDLAYYDSLTNLYNRSKITKEIEKLIKEKDNLKFALLYIGVDDFKYINDSLGHHNGDILLMDLSELLKDIFSSSKIIGRVNGDEFVVVSEYKNNENYIISEINKFLQELKVPWKVKDKEIQVTVSIGIALYPHNGNDFTTLFKNAYTSMIYKKKNGKNGYEFYSYEIDEKNLNYINSINELRQAIKKKEFTLMYQPQVDLINGGIIGTEALIRWKHPKKGIVSPMSFIPLAEEIGYIQGISEWVIETAFAQKRQWEEKGLGNLKISINISNNCLKEKDFLKQFKKMLNKYNVDKKGIIIEITETSIMQNLKEGMIILSKLRESGIKIALDDFGTGYSSLNYLRKLPIDILKIDKDFIKDIEYEMKNEVILKYIIEVGHALGLKIVAEGIETIQQLSLLKTYGCDIGQGYLFSKPLEAEMLEEFSKRI
ncbi:diguanylate cyclase (GGDEF) domain-containing protein [Clostridium cochlearium]|uniref:Diguanylate cyclase (GGDEF) domain-containing protein n=2 Tax=Clostridium cochlearium TaxID=1494 RepID=A0ABY0QLJ2_CLOCO|nr:bifunctional diguanylate cyclase/phosphodiesterase [Clostridium cochlearium]SDL16800.1 diguanylate cyclase (GGDEF) domain-containing protein [Clostridium cochlearium]